MITVVVARPPVLVAVTVYVADAVIWVGVPEMAPVEVEKARPVGSAGTTDHDVTVPPLEVGVAVVIAESLVSVKELGLYSTEDGMMSLTTIVTAVVALPPVLVAVTV